MNKTASTAIFALMAFALVGGIFASATSDVFATKNDKEINGCRGGDDDALIDQDQEQEVDQENEAFAAQIAIAAVNLIGSGDIDEDFNSNEENNNAQVQDADIDQSEDCLID